MPRCETTRDQYGTGSSFIDFDREQGSNVFVGQRPLTKGAVLSAIGDTGVPGDERNPVADLCTTSPAWEEIVKKCVVVSLVASVIALFCRLTPKKKTWRIHRQPRRSSQWVRRWLRHTSTTMPPPLPRHSRGMRFFLRRGDPSSVGKPFRNGIQTCGSRGTPKLHHQGRRECLSLDRHGWQRTLGNRRI